MIRPSIILILSASILIHWLSGQLSCMGYLFWLNFRTFEINWFHLIFKLGFHIHWNFILWQIFLHIFLRYIHRWVDLFAVVTLTLFGFKFSSCASFNSILKLIWRIVIRYWVIAPHEQIMVSSLNRLIFISIICRLVPFT